LQRSLDRTESDQTSSEEAITYLPSRSKSNDGQLLKLRQKDQEAYTKVVQGEMTLKDAFPKTPRKQVDPIESVKNKFNTLSNTDREAFIAWIEQQKDN
jgi:formiminotetrahydrofolate cyclodeaminase